VLAVAQSILDIFKGYDGFGRSIQYLQRPQIENVMLLTTVVIMLNIMGTLLVRISVCLFILRLVPADRKSYCRWIYGFIGLFTAMSLATCLAFTFECIPMQGLWNKNVHAHCFGQSNVAVIAQVQGGK